MATKYCTNCGQTSNTKNCGSCGAKSGSNHNYCAWCGNQLDPAASICPNCKEKVKLGASNTVGTVIGILFVICGVVLGLGQFGLADNIKVNYLGGFLSIVGAILLLPFVKTAIRNATHEKPAMRTALFVLRWIIALALIIAPIAMSPLERTAPSDQQAVEMAQKSLMSHYDFKNESSVTVNNSSVTVREDKANNELSYDVTLDFSAQNGLGGMNRHTYNVVFHYNTQTGQWEEVFYLLNE